MQPNIKHTFETLQVAFSFPLPTLGATTQRRNKSHPLLYTAKNLLGYLKARIVSNKVLGGSRGECSFFIQPPQPPLLVFADERRAD